MSPGVLKVVLPVTILLGASVVSFLLIQARPAAQQTAAPPPALLVSIATAAREPVQFQVRSHGTVSPRTETGLVSEVAGQIVEVDWVADRHLQGASSNTDRKYVKTAGQRFVQELSRIHRQVALIQVREWKGELLGEQLHDHPSINESLPLKLIDKRRFIAAR